MENEEYLDIKDGLSVGTMKIGNKYEIFTEEEIDAINDKIPELDKRVGVIEDEIEEINSSLDNKANKSDLTNSMTPKGNISFYNLPTIGNNIGDYYYCEDSPKIGNYAWNGSEWYFAGTGDEGFSVLSEKINYVSSIVTDVVKYREKIDNSTGSVQLNISGKKGDTICVNLLSYSLNNLNYANLAIKKVGDTIYTSLKDINNTMAIRMGDKKYFVVDSDFESVRLPFTLTSSDKGVITAEIYVLNSNTLLNRVSDMESKSNDIRVDLTTLSEKINYVSSIVTDVVKYREKIDNSTGSVQLNISGKKGDTICVNLLSYSLNNLNYANLAIKKVGDTIYTSLKDINNTMAIRMGDKKYFVVDSDFESVRLPFTLTSSDKGIAELEVYILNHNTLTNRVELLESKSLSTDNVLTGKSISFNGDSICAGAGFTGGYGKIIAEKNNMTYQNVAVSGGSVAEKSGTPYVISNGVEKMNLSDYCILEGGFNDYAYNIPLGIYSNENVLIDENSLDKTTFSGAFEYMIIKSLKKFTGKKIGFIAIHTILLHSDQGLNAYINRAIEICNKWSIPVLDLRKELGYSTLLGDEYNKKYFADAGDGSVGTLHPNEFGYKELYVPKIENWLLQL